MYRIAIEKLYKWKNSEAPKLVVYDFGMCALLFCTNHCFFIDDSFVAIYFYDDFCGDNDSVFEKYVSLNILRINDAYYSCN